MIGKKGIGYPKSPVADYSALRIYLSWALRYVGALGLLSNLLSVFRAIAFGFFYLFHFMIFSLWL